MARERVPVMMDEMCLSIPDVIVPVERHKAVTMQWTDETGDIHMGDFDGAEARVIQHEFDHLNGQVHFDRISPICAPNSNNPTSRHPHDRENLPALARQTPAHSRHSG